MKEPDQDYEETGRLFDGFFAVLTVVFVFAGIVMLFVDPQVSVACGMLSLACNATGWG